LDCARYGLQRTFGVVQSLEDMTREFITTEEQDVEWLLSGMSTVEINIPAVY
jgi:hypothetical protein